MDSASKEVVMKLAVSGRMVCLSWRWLGIGKTACFVTAVRPLLTARMRLLARKRSRRSNVNQGTDKRPFYPLL